MAEKKKNTLRKTLNDLPEKVRANMVPLLEARLADSLDLYGQLKQAHWNVKGGSFIALHELFDEIAKTFLEFSDDLAERSVQLGGSPRGSARATASATSLKDYPAGIYDGSDHVKAVAQALAAFGKKIRDAIDASDEGGDKDTADLFTGISRAVDKNLWFVEAHRG